MRAVVLSTSVQIAIFWILNLSLCTCPAFAAGDTDAAFRLKSTMHQLLSYKRNLERDVDKTTDQISRLERVRDYNSVARALDDLEKNKLKTERQLHDVLIDIRDVENDLRACK